MREFAVHPGFILRKNKILQDLSVPDAQYTDLSPKGSVDEGIRDLIYDINVVDGLVTTSSCAGRVSVFVEGTKQKISTGEPAESDGGLQRNSSFEKSLSDLVEENSVSGNPSLQQPRQFVTAGGKGTGRWLYVSHDPVSLEQGKDSIHQQFGLTPGSGVPHVKKSKESTQPIRLVRFLFEPMVCVIPKYLFGRCLYGTPYISAQNLLLKLHSSASLTNSSRFCIS
jgi:tRNA wybutosine-synthesizing protein 3